jgi:chitodextrinase
MRRRTRYPLWLGLLIALAIVPVAEGSRGGSPTYPKSAAYAYGVGDFTPAQAESLSWFDLVNCTARPEVIEQMRERNPDQKILFWHMPQTISSEDDGETFWYADTSWSLLRLCQFYSLQNDWYLYDTSGARMEQWGGWVANWTRYCPLGTFGTSKGMTYAEWYADVALPQIAFHSLDQWGEPWGWNSSAYNGVAWETLYECPACCEVDQFKYADPDRDGLPEGVDGTCFDGDTAGDSLRILYHEVNEDFHARLQASLPSDFVINVNRGGVYLNPDWAWDLNGLKLEDWNPSRTNPIKSWWSWMYGRRSPWAYIGDGYEFAERSMHRSGIDALDGWDMTWVVLWTKGQTWAPAYAQRMQRFGLGTALLGDGYFIYTKDWSNPIWFDQLSWDLGAPLEDYQRELYGSDTLYVRTFEHAVVEVNPYPRSVHGVPMEDSRFGFWLTLEDVQVEGTGPDYVSLTWVTPDGEVNGVDEVDVRYATHPIDAENWDACTPAPLGPAAGAPGERMHYAVRELAPETTYYLAARNMVHGRLDPRISNVVSATTAEALPPPPPPEEDEAPPAAITDLASPSQGEHLIILTWTATGDDGAIGTAHHYELRYRTGGTITTEYAWNNATPVTSGLPAPGPAGTLETYHLSGLASGTGYGVAVRAIDEAGNRSGLSNPFLAETEDLPPPPPPPPADLIRPGAIGDLTVLSIGETTVGLRWSCPGDDGMAGVADHFVLGWLANGTIESEATWSAADTLVSGLPAPLAAGEPVVFTLTGLAPGTPYSLMVRAYDDAGLRSALGNAVFAQTIAPDDETAPAPVADLRSSAQGAGWLDLAWTAPGNDGAVGKAARYEMRYRIGGAIAGEADWASADTVAADVLPLPEIAGSAQTMRLADLAPQTLYGVAIRAVDEAGNRAAVSNAFTAATLASPDTLPPAAIDDLAIVGTTADGFDLEWRAPGDDGDTGLASLYVLAYRAGGAITDEAGWLEAQRDSLHALVPLRAGRLQAWSLSGLAAGTLYGLALRAYDEAGNLSPLPPVPLVAETRPPRDLIPPAAILDLALRGAGESSLELGWSAPGDDGDVGRATRFEIAWIPGATPIDSEEHWASAVIVTAGLPEPPAAGGEVTWALTGLEPGHDYTVAVRAYDDAGLAGPLGNSLLATTLELPPPPPPPPPADTTPPAAIEDLAVATLAFDHALLSWSSPGDDGMTGRADRFVLGWRLGAPIGKDEDWAAADTLATDLPAPGEPGSAVEYTLHGLTPQQSYTVAVRARDDSGLISQIGPAVAFTTPAAPDTLPPGPVSDLAAELIGTRDVQLVWTATGDDGGEGRAVSAIVARRAGQMIESEIDWLASDLDTLACDAAGGERDSVLLRDLDADADWGFAVRCVDDAGLTGGISNFVTLYIPALPADSDTIPPAPVDDPRVTEISTNGLTLRWSPAGDDGDAGAAAGYELAILPGERIGDGRGAAIAWQTVAAGAGLRGEMGCEVEGLIPGASYGLALRACDEAGNSSPMSPSLWVPGLDAASIGAPDAVTDLRAAGAGPEWVELAWSSPVSGNGLYPVDRFEIARAASPIDEAGWSEADSVWMVTVAAGVGETQRLRIEGLESDTAYWFALRSDNGLGYRSEISNPVAARTPAIDRLAPVPPAAPELALDPDGESVRVAWAPVTDGDLAGYHVYGRANEMSQRQRLTGAPVLTTEWDFARPFAATNFFVCVTALDATGNESEPSPEVALFPTELALDGPFPHPIEDEARFRLALPVDAAGAFAVRAEILSITGEIVRHWIDESMPAGLSTTLRWDTRTDGGERVAPGLYFLRLRAGGQSLMQKLYVSR